MTLRSRVGALGLRERLQRGWRCDFEVTRSNFREVVSGDVGCDFEVTSNVTENYEKNFVFCAGGAVARRAHFICVI